ncbi:MULTISPECIES: winged helix-turn-helix domain-containing protein [unclassified Arthrobacter]|uniref:winged helix-turn-helix domain-containing protein n=1 Tax=unclassified Arthrobacter TaxID=235627 RepID=UPI00339A8D78
MAVNVHAPYPRPRAGSRPGDQSGTGTGAGRRPGLQPRGLAVWLRPCEGQEIDPAVWAQAAQAVLARAFRLAPEAEVQMWPDADDGTAAVEGSDTVDPPVSLAGRRSTVAVDLAAGTVLLDGVPVSFTGMEYSLLRYLVQNQSRPIQRGELQRVLESLDCPGAGFRSIDAYVARVRRKLGSARYAIATVRGGGYQFVPGPGSTVRGPAEYCI